MSEKEALINELKWMLRTNSTHSFSTYTVDELKEIKKDMENYVNFKSFAFKFLRLIGLR
jgi:hypothetical protein